MKRVLIRGFEKERDTIQRVANEMKTRQKDASITGAHALQKIISEWREMKARK